MGDNVIKSNSLFEDLRLAWAVTWVSVFSLFLYVLAAHYALPTLQGQFALAETQRLVLRTVFYCIGIVTLPLTNLIRHIQIRLNQTMPGLASAKKRYLGTVIVSMALVESIGIYGFLMFILGDDFNTLYILISMSALGMFLYRPKEAEYRSIIAALAAKNED